MSKKQDTIKMNEKLVVDKFEKFIVANFKKKSDYYHDKHILIRFVRDIQNGKYTMVQAFCESGNELRFHGCAILPCDIGFIKATKTCAIGFADIIDRFFKPNQDRIDNAFAADDIIEFDLHAKFGSLADCANTSFSLKYYDQSGNRYFTKRDRNYNWVDDERKDYQTVSFYSMNTGRLIENVSCEALTSKEWIVSKPRNPLSKSDERIINSILSMPAIKGAKTCVIRNETNCSDREVHISGIDKTGRHEAFELTIKNLKDNDNFAAFPDRSNYKYNIINGKIGQLDYSCVNDEYGK